MPVVKQCAHLPSVPSQVSQGSLKFCQCWLWDEQRINGPGPPFPKRQWRCPAQCWGMAQPFPCSLHSRETLGKLCPLVNTTLSCTQPLISSVSHSKNICSTRSFQTPQRSILEMEMTHSNLSGFLSVGTLYCTTSSQVTTQPLPWPATRRECRTQPTLSKIRSCPFL